MTQYVPLTPTHYSARRWQRYQDYRHVANQHWVPIAAPEVVRAASHLPLAFVRPKEGQPAQFGALLGLKAGVNHCINKENRWQLGYVPSLLRAHPFRVLPTQPGSMQRTLCVDADSPWLSGDASERFFTEEGELTPSVQKALTFLTSLEKHLYRTQQAVNSLDDLGLLVPLNLKSVEGHPIVGVLQVDETALNKLPDDAWLSLRKSGGAAIAYAQLISTGQLPMLRQRALEHQHEAGEPIVDVAGFFDDMGDDDDLSFNFDS